MCIIGIFSCDQPGTFATNDYCLVTPNIWLYRCLIFFTAYCVVDGLVGLLFIRDHKAYMEMYFHHVLGIAGSSCGFFGGGYLTVISSVSFITEFSTPFVNIRSLLYDHDIKSGSLYAVNGTLMTLMFFLCRIVFQWWLVFTKLFPLVWKAPQTTPL